MKLTSKSQIYFCGINEREIMLEIPDSHGGLFSLKLNGDYQPEMQFEYDGIPSIAILKSRDEIYQAYRKTRIFGDDLYVHHLFTIKPTKNTH